jgi:hypothetical protein
MDTLIIAQHLNIAQTAITKVESWANCLFVVAKGIGARFVSKQILKAEKAIDWQNDPRYGFAEEESTKNGNRENELLLGISCLIDLDTKKTSSKWTTWELDGYYSPSYVQERLAIAKSDGFTVFYNKNQSVVGVLSEQI